MSEHFSVHLTRSVEDDIEEMKLHREKIVKELLCLEEDPYKGHPLRGALKGLRSMEFSLPGGACRAVYGIKKKERVCLLIIVGYHKEIYERAERRVKSLRQQKVLEDI